MTGLSFLIFCLGVLFGSGAFFRKGGEMLATYALAPILFTTLIMGMKTPDSEMFLSQINKAALYGGLLGFVLLLGFHTARIRQEGGLSFAGLVPNFRLNFRTLWSSPFAHTKAAGRSARNASTIYYQTAIKLGALTTAIDKTRAGDGYAVIKVTFNLNRSTCPEALDIFNAQMRHPERLSVILRPFLNQYGTGSAIAETLIFGMCKVALADRSASHAEIRLIIGVAKRLGLHVFDVSRIVNSAGIQLNDGFSASVKSWQERMRAGAQYDSGQSSGSNQTNSKPWQSERDTHLATLGLPADASLKDAKTAWRKLAKKYHPDKLISQNLPTDEMAKAEAMMQAINKAYDWLKEHPR